MEKKRASKTPLQALGRLIEAQDRERMRIAQELHEDIGSSLATLGIDLLKLGKPVSSSHGKKRPDPQQLYQQLQEIGLRVSHLSNRLRPPMLKYFGLAKAIESECREFSEEYRLPTSCSCQNIPAALDPGFALNFFRVLQEALQNTGRHSHATGVTVDASATVAELTLVVTDDGVGFDKRRISSGTGLGFTIMRQRMQLIGGRFEIRSKPGKGVRISFCAPLGPVHE
jgi:signal transduction histidine kinase